MSQTRITSFFITRKRPAIDDIASSKNKIPHLELVSDDGTNLIKGKVNVNKSDICDVIQSSELINDTKDEGKKDNLLLQQPLTEQACKHTHASVATPFAKKNNSSNISKASEVSKTQTIQVARKELSLGNIRKKLAGSSRLAEIKASAERISKGIQQLKETGEQRNLKEFKSIDVEVPTSPSKRSSQELLSPKKDHAPTDNQERFLISPRKVYVSPVKSPNKVPAYVRHASLATSSTSLPLPHQYKFLAELFRGIETVVALLYNRNEKITFTKLKPSIQKMLKRNFTEKHLAQVKHLVPDFYSYEIQKIKSFTTSSHKETYELVIWPNLPNNSKVMNPSALLERCRFFYETLLRLVKKHHAQYLSSLDPPMIIPDNKLVRWHPEFDLEKLPEINCAKLPQLPNTQKLSSAQDVLAKARDLFKCNTKMERALEKLAEAKARGLTNEEKAVTGINDDKWKTVATNTPSTSTVNILNPALRNLPASLLEKVKAKQAAKALEAMTRSTENEQKYLVYSRLPDLARTLRNIFVTERKNVLAMNIILSKLDSSFKANVSASDLQKDIKLLIEEIPEWIKLHDVRNVTYLKLDKNANLKNIISKLETLAEKYRND